MSNEIKQLILQHTGGSGCIMRLRGRCCGKARREILEAATGFKWPLAQAGVNRVFEEVRRLACVDPRQTAKALEDAVAAWVKS